MRESEEIMNRQKFLEEITNNFTELYVETFTIRYLNTFKEQSNFEDDFLKSLPMLDKKLKEKFTKKIEKIKVIHYE